MRVPLYRTQWGPRKTHVPASSSKYDMSKYAIELKRVRARCIQRRFYFSVLADKKKSKRTANLDDNQRGIRRGFWHGNCPNVTCPPFWKMTSRLTCFLIFWRKNRACEWKKMRLSFGSFWEITNFREWLIDCRGWRLKEYRLFVNGKLAYGCNTNFRLIFMKSRRISMGDMLTQIDFF